MRYLPCLRWSRRRWWLPLDCETANELARFLLTTAPADVRDRRSTTTIRPAGSPAAVERLCDLLCRDPALFIYTALRAAESVRRRPAPVTTPARLARWLAKHAERLFGQQERLLGAPELDEAARQRWVELAEQTRRLPIDSWLMLAPQWLAVQGEGPPQSWIARWPQVRAKDASAPAAAGDAAVPKYVAPTLPLADLVGLRCRERQLRERFDWRLQEEKLASLKQFAYGLTHEINNPLANIVTRAEQLQIDEDDPQRRDSLGRVVRQAMRAHEMLADVMFFAHPPRPQLAECRLDALVVELMDETQALHPEVSSEVSADSIAGEQARCRVDAAMVRDAMAAMLRNAAEATGPGGRAVLRLVRQGQHVVVSVADNGPGLSDEARRHAFDPYYSGREAGRGLGLGLCRVYRVGKLHGGGAAIGGGPVGCIVRMWISGQLSS